MRFLGFEIGEGLSKTVAKNSSLNAVKTVVLAALTFITTPIILNKLGVEQYGIWALVISFASYANFLELGFNNAVTRLVASEKSQFSDLSCQLSDKSQSVSGLPVEKTDELRIGELKSENRPLKTENRDSVASQINSTVLTYIFISITLFLIALLALSPLKSLLFKNISVPFLNLMLLGTLACFLLNLTTSNYLSVLTGRLRMDLTNLIAVTTNLTQAIVSITLLYSGWGLMAVFAASVISSVLGSVLAVILAKREYPALYLSLKDYSLAKIRSLMTFSLKVYFIGMMQNFLVSTNKFIISALAGLQFVAYYEIGWKVVHQVRVFFQNILEPVYPASAMVVSSEDKVRMVNAYKKAFRYLLFTSIVVYGTMFLLSYPVFLIWLGKEYVQISLIAIIIGIGDFVNLQTASGFYFLASLNRLQSALLSAIFTLAGNFAFGAIGWYFFGFWGMIAGFSLALVISGAWFITVSHHELTQINNKLTRIHELS